MCSSSAQVPIPFGHLTSRPPCARVGYAKLSPPLTALSPHAGTEVHQVDSRVTGNHQQSSTHPSHLVTSMGSGCWDRSCLQDNVSTVYVCSANRGSPVHSCLSVCDGYSGQCTFAPMNPTPGPADQPMHSCQSSLCPGRCRKTFLRV